MNDASESSKIVNLNQRLEASRERVGGLLQGVRDIASRRLQQSLGTMFDQVDDALFDLAEKAESNAVQVHYFDGMREVRKRRPMIERNYLAQLGRNLGEFGSGRRAAPAEPAPAVTGAMELTLVADNELEESLAITSMISKTETRFGRELFAVNQRLSVICGGVTVDDSTNPVAPASLAQGFRQAMRDLPAEVRVKLIIYKLFDRYVLSGLDDLYQEINNQLMRAGVLPQLRHGIKRADGAHGRGSDSAAAVAHDQAQEADSQDQDEASSRLLQTLQTLFNTRRGSSAGKTGRPPTSQPPPSANELLGALSVLQSQIVHGGTDRDENAGSSAVQMAREVAQLKEHLLAQIGSLRGERHSQVANIDEDTIDLVGMLFEFVLEDRNLPAQMQVLLARLQIPYLKAAILDRRLFSHRQHPARRLLDNLADIAKSWSEESDKDHRLLDRVRKIVEQLLHDFDDDMGIFERLVDELQQFQEVNRRRSDLAEQRVAESTRGREKLEQARRRAAREILDRIAGKRLPPLIHGVLSRAWANFLVLTLLRQGEASAEFSDALCFIEDFIESTRLGHDEPGRRKLRAMMPEIDRSLRQGLANVAFQESDIEKLLGHLHSYYREQLGEAEATDTSKEHATLPIPESVQALVDVPEAGIAKAKLRSDDELAPIDPEQLEQVMTLKPGSWIELCLDGGATERAKLSWISPMSGRYLFVNRRGLKVGDYAPHELAALLTAGKASLLDSTALFDRALDSIVNRLSQPDDTANSSASDKSA